MPVLIVALLLALAGSVTTADNGGGPSGGKPAVATPAPVTAASCTTTCDNGGGPPIH